MENTTMPESFEEWYKRYVGSDCHFDRRLSVVKADLLTAWNAAITATATKPVSLDENKLQEEVAILIIKNTVVTPRKNSEGVLVNGQLKAASAIIEFMRPYLSSRVPVSFVEILEALRKESSDEYSYSGYPIEAVSWNNIEEVLHRLFARPTKQEAEQHG